MTCKLEKQLANLLDRANIKYSIPEYDKHDPTNLDFYLSDLNIYIEIKLFHSPRIAMQLQKVPEKTTAIVLQGPNAIDDFVRFIKCLM